MASMTGPGTTLVFLGYADPSGADDAARFEDEVLPLVEEHGGRVVFRGRRRDDDASHPAEVHVLWFPDHDAIEHYREDPRRAAIVARFGQVFESTTLVELDPVPPFHRPES